MQFYDATLGCDYSISTLRPLLVRDFDPFVSFVLFHFKLQLHLGIMRITFILKSTIANMYLKLTIRAFNSTLFSIITIINSNNDDWLKTELFHLWNAWHYYDCSSKHCLNFCVNVLKLSTLMLEFYNMNLKTLCMEVWFKSYFSLTLEKIMCNLLIIFSFNF